MKKQIVSITVLFIVILLLASCTGLFMPTGEISESTTSSVVTTEISSESSSANPSEAPPTSFDHDIPFEVQYDEMAGPVDDFQFPNLIVVKSVEELQTNTDVYKDVSFHNGTEKFSDKIESYDDAFFENSFIVIVMKKDRRIPHGRTIDGISGDGIIKITVMDSGGGDQAVSKWIFFFEIDKKYEHVPFKLSINYTSRPELNYFG